MISQNKSPIFLPYMEIVTDNGYERGISISFLFQEYFIHQKKIQSVEYIKQYI